MLAMWCCCLISNACNSESDDFKRLRRAVEKAHGDREKAIAFVCRLYNVRTLDALPGAVRGAVVALLDQ